jgi:serine/threonine-protein kinase
MGEVYRARDTKLGRDVAIKILPLHFTADPERRSVSHPRRVCLPRSTTRTSAQSTLGTNRRCDGAGLELVEGPTPPDRLERGPVPFAEALVIARQIAEALDAAHEKGIVHRDLKPGNIMLQCTPNAAGVPSGDVRAMMVDFGLAKTMAVGLEDDLTQRPSSSLDGTEEGRILGTPA